jgi:hypothetical protein
MTFGQIKLLVRAPGYCRDKTQPLVAPAGLTQPVEKVGIVFRPIPWRARADKGGARDRHRFSQRFFRSLYTA